MTEERSTSGSEELPSHVRAKVQRILEREARLLRDRRNADAASAAALIDDQEAETDA